MIHLFNVPLNTISDFTDHSQRTRVTLNDDVVNFCHIICHLGKWLLKMQKQLLFFCQISTPQEIFFDNPCERETLANSEQVKDIHKESFISCPTILVTSSQCGKYSCWGNLSILGNFYHFLSILGNFWTFFAIFCNFWTFQYYCARLPEQPYFPHCGVVKVEML